MFTLQRLLVNKISTQLNHEIKLLSSLRFLGSTENAPSTFDVFKSNSRKTHVYDFSKRHIGPNLNEQDSMLTTIGCTSLEDMVDKIVPDNILRTEPIHIGKGLTEGQALDRLSSMAEENNCNVISLIGTGFYGTVTPSVITKDVLGNSKWYSAYSPYQFEISQGRLEALFIFQSMIADLTGLDVSNSSLLDESSAAAEAMNMAHNSHKKKRSRFLVSDRCHPQTLAVLETRAESLKIKLEIVDIFNTPLDNDDISGLLVQYPTTDGVIYDYTGIINKAANNNIITVCSADLLSLSLIKSPGEMGFDIAVGTSQRFGVQPGFGGPSAGYICVRQDNTRKLHRALPGRIVGETRDRYGNKAKILVMQTREQHIKRDKATSNICTSQALLAKVAAFYATYHGPDGIKEIASNIHTKTVKLADILRWIGYDIGTDAFFDTIKIIQSNELETLKIHEFMESNGINIRKLNPHTLTISLDETITDENLSNVIQKFAEFKNRMIINYKPNETDDVIKNFGRKTPYLTNSIFNQNRSETNMMRLIDRMVSKDMSLLNSMIPLGSCTMKLNSAAEIITIFWKAFSRLHPFAPSHQREGYRKMFRDLERDLADITGMTTTSLQPNAGSQGEYVGLRMIVKYHEDRSECKRKICFIPSSAHGTNPASAHIAGMDVVTIKVDTETGQIDMNDLYKKCREYENELGAIMITYPSTYGVYDDNIKEICDMVHKYGGQVYLDGANMNAQVGITSPGAIGADVCHLNLHKTFCIPHGGGGPGVGPVCVAAHLVPYLPTHPLVPINGTNYEKSMGCVTAAPWGSAGILPIVWMYIKMMGDDGLLRATQTAMLNANYMAKKLEPHYNILYKGKNGYVAHEFIIDLKEFTKLGITENEIAKRLMDFNFHAPTMSWPVPRSLMIEPTESESKDELDRFIQAMICIREEIKDIENGIIKFEDAPLKNSPHTLEVCTADQWDRVYSRQQAAYPLEWLKERKLWPAVSEIDRVFGEKNQVLRLPPT